jgi:hypothetical protein
MGSFGLNFPPMSTTLHQRLNFLRARGTIACLIKARLQRHPLQAQWTLSRPWCPAPLAVERPTVMKAANAKQGGSLIQPDAYVSIR